MIIEPMQSEGGDRHADFDYFRRLRQLALDEGGAFDGTPKKHFYMDWIIMHSRV